MRRAHGGETVAAVSHMGLTRALISHLAGIPLEETYALPFPSTGVSVFSLQGDEVRAEMLNDASHV